MENDHQPHNHTDKQPANVLLSVKHYIHQNHPKKYQRILVYYCLTALAYCLIRRYDTWPCCIPRNSFANFFIAPLLNVVELFGGLYQWIWRHTGDAPSAGWMFTFYITLFLTAALCISTMLNSKDDNSIMAEMASGLAGILMANMIINLSLIPVFGENDSRFYYLIHLLLSNRLVLFTAAFFIMISLHQVPFLDGRLNGLMMFTGFGTGLVIVVASGVFPFFIAVNSKLGFFIITNICLLAFGLALSVFFVKILRIQKMLDKHKDQESDSKITANEDVEAIKDRIIN